MLVSSLPCLQSFWTKLRKCLILLKRKLYLDINIHTVYELVQVSKIGWVKNVIWGRQGREGVGGKKTHELMTVFANYQFQPSLFRPSNPNLSRRKKNNKRKTWLPLNKVRKKNSDSREEVNRHVFRRIFVTWYPHSQTVGLNYACAYGAIDQNTIA